MTILLLARHARSTSNAAGTLAGRLPGIALDETGRGQAMTLGERLRGVNLSAVVCSPMQRCQETAELALASAGIQATIHLDERVIETDYGQWAGRLLKDLVQEPAWRTVQTAPSEMVFPDGESLVDVQARMLAAIDDWNARLGPDAVWLCLSHGDLIALALSSMLGQQLDDYQRITTDPASVSVVQLPPPPKDALGADAAESHVPSFPRVLTMNSIAGQLRGFLPKDASQAPEIGGGLGAAGGPAPTDTP